MFVGGAMYRMGAGFILITLFCVSCGDAKGSKPKATQTQDGGTPSIALVEYPSGWEEIVVNSPFAKVTIDSVGHFATDRNGCWVAEMGAIPLDDWNILTQGANFLAKNQLLAEAVCTPAPESPQGLTRGYYGTAEIKIAAEKKMFFELKGQDICTKISDPTVAASTLKAINNVLLIAAKEGCPSARF